MQWHCDRGIQTLSALDSMISLEPQNTHMPNNTNQEGKRVWEERMRGEKGLDKKTPKLLLETITRASVSPVQWKMNIWIGGVKGLPWAGSWKYLWRSSVCPKPAVSLLNQHVSLEIYSRPESTHKQTQTHAQTLAHTQTSKSIYSQVWPNVHPCVFIQTSARMQQHRQNKYWHKHKQKQKSYFLHIHVRTQTHGWCRDLHPFGKTSIDQWINLFPWRSVDLPLSVLSPAHISRGQGQTGMSRRSKGGDIVFVCVDRD